MWESVVRRTARAGHHMSVLLIAGGGRGVDPVSCVDHHLGQDTLAGSHADLGMAKDLHDHALADSLGEPDKEWRPSAWPHAPAPPRNPPPAAGPSTRPSRACRPLAAPRPGHPTKPPPPHAATSA